MAKLMNVKDTRWAFYEAMENGNREAMADYFETLMHHYQDRGKKINNLRAIIISQLPIAQNVKEKN